VDGRNERQWYDLVARHRVDQVDIRPAVDASLIVTSPQEVQKNLDLWRRFNARIHIIV
jgi:hypothetical protein